MASTKFFFHVSVSTILQIFVQINLRVQFDPSLALFVAQIIGRRTRTLKSTHVSRLQPDDGMTALVAAVAAVLSLCCRPSCCLMFSFPRSVSYAFTSCSAQRQHRSTCLLLSQSCHRTNNNSSSKNNNSSSKGSNERSGRESIDRSIVAI